MFKIVLLGLLAAVAIDARYQYRYRRGAEPDLKAQAAEVYSKAKEHFPDQEWKAFWGKLVQASGQTSDELKNKLKANNYNMDMTLEELGGNLKNKATEYPLLNQQYNRIKTQWQSTASNLQGNSLQELFNQAKGYLEQQLGHPISVDDLQSKVSTYLAAIYSGQKKVYRYRRDANLKADASEIYNKAKENFPDAEWQAFWSKLVQASGSTQQELQQKLAANNFDMDMTLEELGGNLKNKATEYPLLNQQYNRIKSQWQTTVADLKGDSLQEFLGKAKTFVESQIGGPLDAANIKQYLNAIFSAGAKHRVRRDTNLKAEYESLKTTIAANFPKAEYDAFMQKLGEKAQLSQADIKAKLQANQGNLDLTMEEVFNKAKTNYPDEYANLQSQYNTLKSKFEQAKGNMDETTLNDLLTKGKAYLNENYPNLNTENLRNILANLWSTGGRRYRREVPAEFQGHVDDFKRQFGDKFPKTEWDAFWPKLQEFFQDMGMDAKTELAKHDGNMDLTLDEVKDKAFNKYPALKQSWERTKQQIDQSVDKADETTLRDAFSFMKTHAEAVLGRPINEATLKEFTGNMQSYLATVFSRMNARYW